MRDKKKNSRRAKLGKKEKKERIISVKEISPPIKSVKELSAKEFNDEDKGEGDSNSKELSSKMMSINLNGFSRQILHKEQADFDEPSSGFSPGSPSSPSSSGAGSINLEETALREVASRIIPEDIPNRRAPGGARALGDESGRGQTAGAGQTLGSYTGRTERIGDYESVRVMPERRRGRMQRFVERSPSSPEQGSMAGGMAEGLPAVAERVDIEKPISRFGDVELSRGVNMESTPQAQRSMPFVEPQQIGSEQYYNESYAPKYVEAPQSEALSDALSSDFFLKRRRKDDV